MISGELYRFSSNSKIVGFVIFISAEIKEPLLNEVYIPIGKNLIALYLDKEISRSQIPFYKLLLNNKIIFTPVSSVSIEEVLTSQSKELR